MPGRQWFAIAAIGADRLGIVADLSECVHACGCNLEDASMTMLGNEFATLMLVSSNDPSSAERLSTETRRIEWERRLTIFVRPLEGEPRPALDPEDSYYRLTAQGVDKAGIVAGISRCLADHGVDITDLRGRVTPLPQTGTPLYTLELSMAVPKTVDFATFRKRLTAIGERLDVEVTIQAED